MNESIAERAAREIIEQMPLIRDLLDSERTEISAIVERAIAESQPAERICICELPDYEGQPKLNGGWDKECPVHGEVENPRQQLTDCKRAYGKLFNENAALQGRIDELIAERQAPQPDDLGKRAMKVLHDLTPGGSEFYNEPKRCAEYIQEKLYNQAEITKRAIIRAKNAELGGWGA